MKHQFLGLLIVFFIVTSCSNSSKKQLKKSEIQAQQLDSLFNFSHLNGMYNGAVLVTKNDTIIYKNTFGYANEETKKEITPESVFYIASVSKQFTAMGIMILQERDKLSYDNEIKDFFPEFPSYLQKITIRQLLNHTSGITDAEYYKLINPDNKKVLQSLLKQDSLGLKNGTTFRYSNSGYVLLALIIEKVSEKSIDQFFKQEVFKPLEMNNTTATKEVAQKMNKIVKGYTILGNETTYKSSVIGPAGIYSSINDLKKYNSALNSNKLIKKETLNKAFKNGELLEGPILINMSGKEYGYGFGWMPINKGNKRYVRHDGMVDGFRSLIKKNLTDGYDYIFLTNQSTKLAMDELIHSIDFILEKSVYLKPQIPVKNILLNQLKINGVKNLASNVKTKIDTNSNDYSIKESETNRLAYGLLRDGEIKIAIEIFKLNTLLFPNSANTFDSLGEAYFANKQYNLSKLNYTKVLEIDGANENAPIMITKINTILNN